MPDPIGGKKDWFTAQPAMTVRGMTRAEASALDKEAEAAAAAKWDAADARGPLGVKVTGIVKANPQEQNVGDGRWTAEDVKDRNYYERKKQEERLKKMGHEMGMFRRMPKERKDGGAPVYKQLPVLRYL